MGHFLKPRAIQRQLVTTPMAMTQERTTGPATRKTKRLVSNSISWFPDEIKCCHHELGIKSEN
ncbi:MAG TPA: hypothetical protein PKV98_09470, partial [Burkholderiaceae bacterium]|nr:hypothetical protein [Burkholderiaceae bacterium]